MKMTINSTGIKVSGGDLKAFQDAMKGVCVPVSDAHVRRALIHTLEKEQPKGWRVVNT